MLVGVVAFSASVAVAWKRRAETTEPKLMITGEITGQTNGTEILLPVTEVDCYEAVAAVASSATENKIRYRTFPKPGNENNKASVVRHYMCFFRCRPFTKILSNGSFKIAL